MHICAFGSSSGMYPTSLLWSLPHHKSPTPSLASISVYQWGTSRAPPSSVQQQKQLQILPTHPVTTTGTFSSAHTSTSSHIQSQTPPSKYPIP
eukprot:14950708-Ditylum_brightwellii.AAC.2